MTDTAMTAAGTLKSRTLFEDLVLNSPMPIDVCNFLNQYPQKGVDRIADLTQNFETLINKASDESFNAIQTPYLVWFIASEIGTPFPSNVSVLKHVIFCNIIM